MQTQGVLCVAVYGLAHLRMPRRLLMGSMGWAAATRPAGRRGAAELLRQGDARRVDLRRDQDGHEGGQRELASDGSRQGRVERHGRQPGPLPRGAERRGARSSTSAELTTADRQQRTRSSRTATWAAASAGPAACASSSGSADRNNHRTAGGWLYPVVEAANSDEDSSGSSSSSSGGGFVRSSSSSSSSATSGNDSSDGDSSDISTGGRCRATTAATWVAQERWVVNYKAGFYWECG
jgi:hypothetical protein